MSPKTVDYEAPKGFKMVEIPVDGNNSVIRRLVPVDTTEDDVANNARLLGEREADGILARSARPERILRGDKVRLRVPVGAETTIDNSQVGTVEEVLRTGKLKVKWDNGKMERYENTELLKVW